MAIIEFEDVKFAYRSDGGTRALDGLSLSVEPGEFACVLGGNGSGKSTLAKHVNALLVPDEGTVRTLGRDTRDADGTFAIRAGAGLVFQNPDDQLVASIVEDDVAFGPGNLGVAGDELRSRVTRSLEQVGLAGFEKREVATLSGGQKQLVAIAGALAMDPQALVLDEATSMLDPRGRANVMRVCRELNDAGITIVFITHFMEEALQAGRVIVLDQGRVALDGTPGEVFAQADRLDDLAIEAPSDYTASLASLARRRSPSPIGTDAPDITSIAGATGAADAAREMRLYPSFRAERGISSVPTWEDSSGFALGMTEWAIKTRFPRTVDTAADTGSATSAKAVLRLENVAYEYRDWALRDVTLEVREGELFGIAGHTGSGKSTLIQLMGGLLKPTRGRVVASGRRDVGIVFQYPERQLFAATVFDDVAFGPRNLRVAEDEMEGRVREALELVGLELDGLRDTSPFALSGGLQRRVAIAGVLAMRPRTLILDEPCAGLDPRARRELLGLVCELRDGGMTVVMVSHDLRDLARLADRVAILNAGTLEMVGPPAEAFADESRLREIGLMA